MKIIQFQIGPDTNNYQGVILGLGDDGNLYYWHEVNDSWVKWGKE